MTKTGKHRSIIAVVGGNMKAIIGTENIDIPIPTEPLTIPPIRIEKKMINNEWLSKLNIFYLLLSSILFLQIDKCMIFLVYTLQPDMQLR